MESKEKKHWLNSLINFTYPKLALLALVCLHSDCKALIIKGTLSKDVLLPCIVKYKEEFDYQLLVVNWQRSENDAVVHTFFHGSSQSGFQEDSYIGRTQIFYGSLPEGNASLLLKTLTKSDAGNYTCHVILDETSGYTTQHVNLIIEDGAEVTYSKPLWLLALFLLILLFCIGMAFGYWYGKRISKRKYEPIIEKYRIKMESKITDKVEDHFARQFLVVDRHLLRSQDDDVSFGDRNIIVDASELFTPANKHLLSRRMLLLGDAGAGKSFFCKCLQLQWLRKENMFYKCIIYVSCKKILTENEKISVKEILQQICEDLHEVLHMPEVLLILDGLDQLACSEKHVSVRVDDIEELPEKKQTYEIDVAFDLNTLVENILVEKLLPETNVLIVSRHGLPLNKWNQCCTFVLQDLNEKTTALPPNMTAITYNPAFVVIMKNLSTSFGEIKEYISPYEFLTNLLQKYLKELEGGDREDSSFCQLASQSYENLIKGTENQSTEQWIHFLNKLHCSLDFKYQCKILRDMLAALHCAWEIRKGKALKDCLDYWVYGFYKRNELKNKPVPEEHSAKYCNFVRFFMRLLPFSNYDTLRNNTSDMDDKTRKEIIDFFKTSMKHNSCNYEKLKRIECVFELHDEHVTNALSSSMEQVSLFNTPLSTLEKHALAYFLANVKLDKLDLRLCELSDKDVKQLKNIIKNTRDVVLSSNNLTSDTGSLLEKVLQEQDCLTEKLALGTNNLGPDGAQALWRALKINKSLTGLYLYDNNIGDEGTSGMLEHLQENNSLRELHLCLNAFGRKGTENIQALKLKKKELNIVLRISESLELLEHVERKVEGLRFTWQNYNRVWLTKLLEVVKADLDSKGGDVNEDPLNDSVDTLVQKINDIQAIVNPATIRETHVEKMKNYLTSIGTHLPFIFYRSTNDFNRKKRQRKNIPKGQAWANSDDDYLVTAVLAPSQTAYGDRSKSQCEMLVQC